MGRNKTKLPASREFPSASGNLNLRGKRMPLRLRLYVVKIGPETEEEFFPRVIRVA